MEKKDLSYCINPEFRFEDVMPMSPVDGEPGKEPVKKKLIGYAARFDTYSEDLNGYHEIIRRGAFKDNLGSTPVFALANHNSCLILGTTKNGSLKLAEDQYGLRCEIEPMDTDTAEEWMTLVEAGAVDKMSFAFRVDGKDGERWLKGDDGSSIRELRRVKLFDVSIVNQPAYQATSVGFRSLDEIRSEGESILCREMNDSVKMSEAKTAKMRAIGRHLDLIELENSL